MTKVIGPVGLILLLAIGLHSGMIKAVFEVVMAQVITPATILVEYDTGDCWRIMDWTRNRLVHCDVPHPLPADTERVDQLRQAHWLRRHGG